MATHWWNRLALPACALSLASLLAITGCDACDTCEHRTVRTTHVERVREHCSSCSAHTIDVTYGPTVYRTVDWEDRGSVLVPRDVYDYETVSVDSYGRYDDETGTFSRGDAMDRDNVTYRDYATRSDEYMTSGVGHDVVTMRDWSASLSDYNRVDFARGQQPEYGLPPEEFVRAPDRVREERSFEVRDERFMDRDFNRDGSVDRAEELRYERGRTMTGTSADNSGVQGRTGGGVIVAPGGPTTTTITTTTTTTNGGAGANGAVGTGTTPTNGTGSANVPSTTGTSNSTMTVGNPPGGGTNTNVTVLPPGGVSQPTPVGTGTGGSGAGGGAAGGGGK